MGESVQVAVEWVEAIEEKMNSHALAKQQQASNAPVDPSKKERAERHKLVSRIAELEADNLELRAQLEGSNERITGQATALKTIALPVAKTMKEASGIAASIVAELEDFQKQLKKQAEHCKRMQENLDSLIKKVKNVQ